MNNKIKEMEAFYNVDSKDIIRLAIDLLYNKFLNEKISKLSDDDFKNEIWKDITNYEGIYKISNMGRVIALKRNRIFKVIYKEKRKYSEIRLSKGGITKSFAIHRLVAQEFVNNPNNRLLVNHKNGIKSDNRASNLEWVNNSENINHAIKTGLLKVPSGENHGASIFTNNDILKIRELHASKKYNMAEIGRMFNTNNSRIYEIVSRKTWKHI